MTMVGRAIQMALLTLIGFLAINIAWFAPAPAAPFDVGSSPVAKSAGWGRTADNGKGWVWQRPGAPGNADMMRVMDPTSQYPNGYVRFDNKHGQPIGRDGKPGPNSQTHISRGSDGSWDTPDGWGG